MQKPHCMGDATREREEFNVRLQDDPASPCERWYLANGSKAIILMPANTKPMEEKGWDMEGKREGGWPF